MIETARTWSGRTKAREAARSFFRAMEGSEYIVIPSGITSPGCALAGTGTLVVLSSQEEARMISLCLRRIWRCTIEFDGFYTGPSRTADIEQILVRGVHGPGEVHVVLL